MKPGFYQMSYRGLSFSEAWRLGRGPVGFLIAMIRKLLGSKGGSVCWLPVHECERPCDEAELSAEARGVFLPIVNQARNLGYTDGRLSTMTAELVPSTKEAYGFLALHEDRKRIINVAYAWTEGHFTAYINVAVTGGLTGMDSKEYEFVDHDLYLDPLPNCRKVMVKGRGLEAINAAMLDHMASSSVRTYADYAEVKAEGDRAGVKLWDERIARGLYFLKSSS